MDYVMYNLTIVAKHDGDVCSKSILKQGSLVRLHCHRCCVLVTVLCHQQTLQDPSSQWAQASGYAAKGNFHCSNQARQSWQYSKWNGNDSLVPWWWLNCWQSLKWPSSSWWTWEVYFYSRKGRQMRKALISWKHMKLNDWVIHCLTIR